MIYKTIDELPDGTIYLSHRPYTDGIDDLHYYHCNVTSIVVRDGAVVKRDTDNTFRKYPLHEKFTDTFIMGDTEEAVLKEKLKLIHRIRTDLISYTTSLINKMDTELLSVNYFDIIKLYPEIEI